MINWKDVESREDVGEDGGEYRREDDGENGGKDGAKFVGIFVIFHIFFCHLK